MKLTRSMMMTLSPFRKCMAGKMTTTVQSASHFPNVSTNIKTFEYKRQKRDNTCMNSEGRDISCANEHYI